MPIQFLGNPDLDPESSDTYEAVIYYSHRVINASLGYFFTRFDDKITQVVIPGGYTWENSGEAELSGVEVQVSADFALLGRDDLRLLALPEIETVYFRIEGKDPQCADAPPTTPLWEANQEELDPAPDGVDSRARPRLDRSPGIVSITWS